MKLFTSKNDQNSSWPEYCLYMVAVSYTCRKGAKARVLDNIVYYASADLSPVLIAKLNVNLIGYLREAEIKETRTCHDCKNQGYFTDGLPIQEEGEKDKEDNEDVLLLEMNNSRADASTDWILDSGASRHIVSNDRLLIDSKQYNDEISLAVNTKLVLTKVGLALLFVTARGEQL
ncbi:unnamed protein product [Hyaloperonospora brassicae]|uniref:Peptidase A2 domain-containing protein n=1 Tax=Hyaloperonospora brassicae TaxID=162125 RepID=A0AAV0V1B1_HYABA|nr:unnamed protein product [Hyaloperonospora brassicae]